MFLCLHLIHQPPFFFEQEFTDLENAISDEICGQDVDGIVNVPEKHDYCEENGKAHKNSPLCFILPKYQSQKERQSGMSGEEKVVAGKDAAESFVVQEKRQTYHRVSRERADMSKGDKNGSNQSKKSYAFHRERQAI